MSKMLDALKWAEDQRRRMTTRRTDPEDTVKLARRALEMAGVEDVPEGFLRELGILRNALDSLFKGRDKRSILFTSAQAGEGSTTLATSFSRFLAFEGIEKILVCEMNARRPAFQDVFAINGDAGVTDYFSRRRDLASLLQSTGAGQMDILQVGQRDPSVIQLNLNQVFPQLRAEIHQQYSTLIIDAPPVISCPETPPMTALVDGVVLIVQAGKTKREIVQRAVASIESAGGQVLGIVLNRKKYYIPGFLYKRI